MIKTLINGVEQNSIDVRDRGFQYGDGVFETIAYKNNELQLWAEHMQRLQHSCQRLSLNCPAESSLLEDIKKLQLTDDSVIKIIISRGVSGRGYTFQESSCVTRVSTAYPWPNYTRFSEKGITATICETPVSTNSALAGIKHLNRLDNVLARNEWQSSEIAEGIMLDYQQHIIEGTMSNIFGVLDNELYTPLLTQSGVAGVMRSNVIELAKSMDIPVNIIDISKQNFLLMDAAFVTNSVIGLWVVNKIIDTELQVEFTENELVQALKRAIENR